MKNFLGKFLILRANGKVEVVDNSNGSYFNGSDCDFNTWVHKTIHCDLYECVYFNQLRKFNIVMLVDESGLLKHKVVNPLAWRLYSGWNLEAPIVGDVIFCGLCYEDFGEGFPEQDFCYLTDNQISIIKLAFESVVKR